MRKTVIISNVFRILPCPLGPLKRPKNNDLLLNMFYNFGTRALWPPGLMAPGPYGPQAYGPRALWPPGPMAPRALWPSGLMAPGPYVYIFIYVYYIYI